MFCQFLVQVVECVGAAITKKPHFLPKNRQKKPFFWPETVFLGAEWAVVAPPPLFSGCWTQRNVFCKVLEQVTEFFGAAITKKTAFLPKNGQKKAISWLKTVFLGPEWSVVGLPTLF